MTRLAKILILNLNQKFFLWAARLWVGRRKEPILGYAEKNDEKSNSGSKGLTLSKPMKVFNPIFKTCATHANFKIFF